MSSILYRINSVLSRMVAGVPIGTNLGLFYLLWMLLSGRLLQSRGPSSQVSPNSGWLRRPFGAAGPLWRMASGKPSSCCGPGSNSSGRRASFHAHQYGHYRPVACDLVGFFRPRLQDCPTKHYSSPAGKALPAISVGIAARVGTVGIQRLAIPCRLVRSEMTDTRELPYRRACSKGSTSSWRRTKRWSAIAVFPSGRSRRQAFNAMWHAGRSTLRPGGLASRPTKGRGVNPSAVPSSALSPDVQAAHHCRHTARSPRNLAAPRPASSRATYSTVLGWLSPRRCSAGCPAFSTALIHDPRFDEPLLLNTSLPLTGAQLQAFYLDRWPVEGLPLTAKQMLGAARQFVFAPESRQRLPELALVAGAILMYIAATQPALPTGFWDRTPKPTSGRLRRVLSKVHCADLQGLPEPLRKKQSPTMHLPKGVLGHRRQPKVGALRYDMPLAA